MFPFWEVVIEPIIEIVRPKQVVEIGALRGDTTTELLTTLGDGAELHVVDPVPQFDPAEHERRFPGRYVFHRDLSLAVLPQLSPVDLALVDGDHNWYTVFNELRLLEAAAIRADLPGPVLVLHDVGWPYARRDGYYAAGGIPDEFRQPSERKGMARGEPGLLPTGGLNTHVWNAVREGGPRNGVRTALEDFVAGSERPFRYVVVDLYVGLAVAADRRRLAQHPQLTLLLEELETDAGRDRLKSECAAVVRDALASGALTMPAPPSG